MTATDYNKQAADFLKKHGIQFSAVFKDTSCPPFCEGDKHFHGDKYRVALRQPGRSIAFPFWNSLNDAQRGKDPDAYSVLACIGSDVHCPDTFEDFCAEYGYDEDSRKAFDTFKRCAAFAEKLRGFFTEEQIADLSEIR